MRILFLLTISLCLMTCSEDEEKNSRDADAEAAPIDGFGTITGTLQMDENGETVPAANAAVSIESHPEYSGTADASGNVSIRNVLPGTLTIYATTTTDGSAAELVDSSKVRAAQFKDVLIGAGELTELSPDIVLTEPGKITGTVALLNNPQNVALLGITAYIPGTSFTAKTDDQGKFTISNVPAGSYGKVQFDQTGLTSSFIKDVKVTSGQVTDLGTVNMSLSTGPSGQITGVDGVTSVSISGTDKNVSTSSTVKVNLKYDSRATLMKVAHESSFLNVEWVPVASSYTFTASNNSAATTNYSSDGTKYVYVKFADQNGLESSVYNYEFIIDTQGPTSVTIAIMAGWDQLASTATSSNATISGSDAGTGIKEMMICTTNSFDTCGTWTTYSTSATGLAVSVNMYIKLRDFVGNTSSVASDTINLGTYTILPGGTYAADTTLSKAQSPYSFDADLTFSGNLTIEAGVTINHAGASNKKITVNGRLNATGTSGSNITITTSSNQFGGFDLSASTVDNNSLSYFSLGSGVLGNTFVKINGGTVTNNSITNSFLQIIAEKTGYKTFSASTNTIVNGQIKIAAGSASTITDNDFSSSGSGGCPAVNITGGSNTSVTYNTINVSCNAASTPVYGTRVNAGSATFSYNSVTFACTDTGVAHGIDVSNSGTITVNHNNFNVTSTSANNVIHILNNSSTATADMNYFTGHGTTNPTNSGLTSTNNQGSAWQTTAGTDCVGDECS